MNALPAIVPPRTRRLAQLDSPERIAFEATLGARSFRAFIRMAWRFMDPAHLLWNWHIDLLCEEMEAVARRQHRETVFCIPPRSLKSIIMSVAFPAWVWTWHPSAKFLCGSNEMTLATRDAVKCRRLVKSTWYQKRWGAGTAYVQATILSDGRLHPGVTIVKDQDNKTYYETTAGGHRFACTPGSNVTGHGGDYVMCLPADQVVITDRGPEPIGRVVAARSAKQVLAFNHATGRAEFRNILAFETHPPRELIEIGTEDGNVLRCTVDHPVWVEGRHYVAAEAIGPGAVVMTCGIGLGAKVAPSRVKAVRRLPPPERTYNLSVEGTRNFFASGVLTHNCDDPHPAQKAESEAERNAVLLWWGEAIPSRLNEPDRGAKMVIQQRVHTDDLAGWCIKRGYHKVVLPMRFEPDHPDRHPKDPRTETGEILHKTRISDEALRSLERALGEYATAGQLQQRPGPRDGGLFKRGWFQFVDAVPADAGGRLRRWDLAATLAEPGKDPDWTAGVRVSKDRIGRIYIEHALRLRDTPAQVDAAIKATAQADGLSVPIWIPQDPGQAGVAQAQALVRFLAPYTVRIEKESGDKATRARGLASMLQAGQVFLVRGGWNEEFIDELCAFPNGSHDDQLDAAAGAFNALYGGNLGFFEFMQSQVQAALG